MMGKEDKKVWKAHINEDNHRREIQMIDMMWRVGIAMQRMHMWAMESSPMELVGVHPTYLLNKT